MLIDYCDHRDDMPVTCRHCGWSGLAREGLIEMHEKTPVVDRECPKCFHILLTMPFPTFDQVKAAAGNEEAARTACMISASVNPVCNRWWADRLLDEIEQAATDVLRAVVPNGHFEPLPS